MSEPCASLETPTKESRKNARRSTSAWLLYSEIRNYFKHPKVQRRLWADAVSTHRWFRAVSPEIPPAQPGRVALIGSMSSYLYGNKLEAVLGLGLRLEAWQTRVLLHTRKDIGPRRIFLTYGFTDFVYWEDFAAKNDPQADAEVDAALEKWMQGHLTVQIVKEWTLGPCWLGPQVISMLHRRKRQVELDLNAPEIRRELAEVARFAVARARAASAVLRAVQPSLLYLLEPNYAQFGPLVDHAVHQKIRVVHTVQPIQDDAMYFWRLDLGTRRDHPLTVSAATLEKIVQEPWTQEHERKLEEDFAARYTGKWFLQRRNQVDATPRSRQEIVSQLELDPAKKIVTVFSHVLWDANLFYGSDLFDDYGDWFVQTVQAAYRNDKVNWLIKLHPANIAKRRLEAITTELVETILIREKCGPTPAHVRILLPNCGISSLSLYTISSCGVTVRGTCGLEMPCFGTPVVTAGTGRYSGLGFTIDSATRADYLNHLSNIQEIGPLTEAQIHRARQHAYTLFALRPWKMKSFRAEFHEDLKAEQADGDPLNRNLIPVARTVQEMRKNGDLTKWAQWAGCGHTPDYLD